MNFDKLREAAIGHAITDESPLTLTTEEFITKVMKEVHGSELLDLLESGEWRVAERLGLIHGYKRNNEVYFDIPRWNHFLTHLRLVNGR